MLPMRPTPLSLLPDDMTVRELNADGEFGDPRTIRNVRFERNASLVHDEHVLSSVFGTVFVDATMSDGAFEVKVGSRVEIQNLSLLVKGVHHFEIVHRRVHQWELDVV